MPTRLAAFVATTWLLAMVPGAGQALMLRQTLRAGRRGALPCIAGVATGLMIWSLAAAAGLSAILLSNPGVYGAVRVVGGVVLLGLGVNTLWAIRRSAAAKEGGPGAERRPDRRSGYAAGLATNLGNPKAGVFAISVLPQFTAAHGPVFLSSVGLGALWALVTVCWYLLFTWGVDKGSNLVSRPAVHRRLQLLSGCVLLLLGVAVAGGV